MVPRANANAIAICCCCCLLLAPTTSAPPPSPADPAHDLFFVHTSSETTLSMVASCSVESAARFNPGAQVVLHSNTWTEKAIAHLPPNVQLQRFDLPRLFHGTPLQAWFRQAARWKKGFPLNNLSNGIRLVLLWRYGGTYLDTDMVVVKNLARSLYRNAVGVEADEGELEKILHMEGNYGLNINTAAFVNFQARNAFIELLMHRFVEEFAGDVWGWNGPGLLTRTWKDWNNDHEVSGDSHVQILSKNALYPIKWHELSHLFDPIQKHKDIVELVSGKSLAVHLWQSLLSSHLPFSKEDSVLSMLMSFACPMTHSTRFLPSRKPLDRLLPAPMLSRRASTCATSKPWTICDAQLIIDQPPVGIQFRAGEDRIVVSFVVEVEEDAGAEVFSKMIEDPTRIDVCMTLAKKDANGRDDLQSWCTPLALVRAGNSSLLLPPHAITPGQHSLFAHLVDKETHGVSKASVTTFNVDFREWKLERQGNAFSSAFWSFTGSGSTSTKQRAPQQQGVQPLTCLFIHSISTDDKSVDMPSFNFIDEGLVPAIHRQHAGRLLRSWIWGPGYPGYDPTLSLASNVETRFGSTAVFDMLVYLPPPWPDDDSASLPRQVAALSRVSGDAILAFRQAETTDTELVYRRMRTLHATLLLGTYAHQLDSLTMQPMFSTFGNTTRPFMVAHLPHCAAPNVYSSAGFAVPEADRNVDVLMTGSLEPSVYPFRARLAQLLVEMHRQEKENGVKPPFSTAVRAHPGYSLATRKDAEMQLKHYAATLAKSKIVLITPSKYGMGLAKYLEAQLSGALIVGAIPFERQEYFRRFVVEIKASDEDTNIVRTIKWWLDHPAEREARALIGWTLARRQTWDDWLVWLSRAAKAHRSGWASNVVHSGAAQADGAYGQSVWSSLEASTGMPLVHDDGTADVHQHIAKTGTQRRGNSAYHQQHDPNQQHHLLSRVVLRGCSTRGAVLFDGDDFDADMMKSLFLHAAATSKEGSQRLFHGFTSSSATSEDWFDTMWLCNNLPAVVTQSIVFGSLRSGQTINTFPGSFQAANDKVQLCRHLRRAFPDSLRTFYLPCYVLHDSGHRLELANIIGEARGLGKGLAFLLKPRHARSRAKSKGFRRVDEHYLQRALVLDADQASAHSKNGGGIAQVYLNNTMQLPELGYRTFDVRVFALISEFSSSAEFGNMQSGITKIWVHRRGFARVYHFDQTEQVHGRGDTGDASSLSSYDSCDTSPEQHTRSLGCVLHSFFKVEDRARAWLSIRRAVGKAVLGLREPLSGAHTTGRRCPAGSCYQIIRADVVVHEDGNAYVVDLDSSPSSSMQNPRADGNVLAGGVLQDAWRLLGLTGPVERITTAGMRELLALAGSPVSLSVSEEFSLVRMWREWEHRGGFELAIPDEHLFKHDLDIKRLSAGQTEARVTAAFFDLLART